MSRVDDHVPLADRSAGPTDDASALKNGSAETSSTRPDPKLLELLVCPLTKTNLVYDRDAGELVSHAARLAFPIRDGIPILLASEARELS